MQDGFKELNIEAVKSGKAKNNPDVQIIRVPLSKISPNPYQPRKEFESEALSELADSIRQYGSCNHCWWRRGKTAPIS